MPRRRQAGAALNVRVRRHPLVAEVSRRLSGSCGLVVDQNDARSRQRRKILLAVSGGADSTALLLACCVLRERRSAGSLFLDVAAVHVHHHLRPEADEDAAFVKDLCERLSVDLRVEHVRPGEQRGNVSDNARRMRYATVVEAARHTNASFVLTAHHAEDQLETMLMALARGAGLEGLAGMNWRRSLAEDVWLLRPLLAVHKAQCESMCRAAGIQWCEDASNRDVVKARARLRRDVLPVLEALWPGAAQRAAATAEVIAAARELMRREVATAFGPADSRQWTRADLRRLPPAIIAAGLRRGALAVNPKVADQLGQDQLGEAAQAIADSVRRPRQFDWPGGLVLRITSRLVQFEPSAGASA